MLRKRLEDKGVIVQGHFVGTSGRHLSTYIAKDVAMPDTHLVSDVCVAFAQIATPSAPDIVVGPTTCGIILSQWTAHHLSQSGRTIPSLFTDEENDRQYLRRKYDVLVRGKRVLVVEDVVNTGKSISEVVTEVVRAGGDVVLALSIFNRGGSDAEVSEKLGVPYQSLIHMPLESWGPDEVPAWLADIPVSTDYGHGSATLDGRKDN